MVGRSVVEYHIAVKDEGRGRRRGIKRPR